MCVGIISAESRVQYVIFLSQLAQNHVIFQLNMSFSEFEGQVDSALKHCRDPFGLVQLARSPLAETRLVTDCFFADERPTSTIRGLALRAVLSWAVDRLKPHGEPDWVDYRWRHYLVLHYPYIAGSKSFRELASLMSVGEKAVFDSRQRALTAVAQLLVDELAHPVDQAGRQQAVALARYNRLAKAEQTLLRILAIFRYPIPINFAHQLLVQAGLVDGAVVLRNLVASGLTHGDTRRAEVEAHGELRASILLLLQPQEQSRWRLAAVAHYEQQQDYLEAAFHSMMAQEYVRSAEILIAHYQQIVDNLQIDALRELLREFRPNQLPKALWPEIKLLLGQLAIATQDVDSAIAEFQQATQSSEILVKARAYHQMAQASHQRNMDEALRYYKRTIGLLAGQTDVVPLLPRAHVNRAWLYMEQRSELSLADADLNHAQAVLDTRAAHEWLAIRSDWHSARSFYFQLSQNPAQMVEECWQAWLTASEMNDLERKVNTLHNLGKAYYETGQYDQALVYLAQCEQLCSDTGHRRILSLCHKTIGACHYFLDDKQLAIHHYQIAHQGFSEMNQAHWLAGANYDLAEVFAELGDMGSAKQYFKEGLLLAQSVGAAALVSAFDALADEHDQFGERKVGKQARRQQLALAHVAEFGSISNKAYQELAGVKYRTSLKDLNELVELGKLVRVGEGRGTRYVSAENSNLP